MLGGTCSFSYVVALLLHCKFNFLFLVTVCFVLHLLLGTEKHLNFEAVSTDTNYKFSKQQFGFTIALNERSFLFFYLIVKKKRAKLIPAHMSCGSLHAAAILALWSLRAVEVK